MWGMRKKLPKPPPVVPPVSPEPIRAGGYVTINEAHYVVSVDGDEATISVRDPATGEQRHIIYPISKLKMVWALKASRDAKRTRLAPIQPSPRPPAEPDDP